MSSESPTERARSFLRIEAQAVERAAKNLGPSFEKALGLIRTVTEKRGKLVLMGVGKSHYIAHKLAASFTSTGVTAIFIHPAEALHGDLGSIQDGDVCLLFSKSGTTSELVGILPYLKGRNPIIAITGNPSGLIARQADAVLDASVEQEACPINLLPTASTTVALALGDALMSIFAEQRGLTKQSFAAYHPGGSIGKRLNGRVIDVYSPLEKIPSGTSEISLKEVARLMGERPVGAFCVVDPQGKLQGLLTDGDLRRAFARGEQPETKAGALMNKTPTTLRLEMLIDDAIALMEQPNRRLNCAPVVDSAQRLLGLAHIHDLI
jgi:arabinose-5-phosphate isomerase